METTIQGQGLPRAFTKPRKVSGSGAQPTHRVRIAPIPRKI